ncbi:Glycosyltransferase, GT2 family [Paenibacillus sophorae]|uniref:Glycosyltransferase family 2 protein n=1 Tax=Paenibacillus sophorae TaxID=1333845 RepID=A0A1H8Q7J2_9BACL|nr:glycosyltransferase family 2 protein [Paenibacillus sophorae]QWU15251.1 glycosyltransferase family 2 protein [Paenibacillus sophorae]SEO49723.1 Glycosyltransferase, GT2 family [Paenibacillus sophorae]
MTQTSIIIPTFNGLSHLRTCVDAIRRYTAEPYELIVVDNASSDGTAKYCRSERITFISLPANAGFPSACNRGLQLASGDELLLLNNDVIVSKNWLANLKTALYSSPNTGIVGPVTNYASGRQQVDTRYADIAGFHAAAETANIPDPSKWSETKRLVGLCFLFKREVLGKVGLLDERYSPGHYEDDDYCMRARLHGYRLLIAGDCLVHHEGSASFKEVYRSGWGELIERNRRLYIEKWGIDPQQFI